MNQLFSGQTAVVTGAGQGIGFAIADALCRQGASVVLNDLDERLARQAVAAIQGHSPGRCVACSGDSSDVLFIQRMVDTAVATFGRLDIAIANAGVTLFGDFFDYPPDALQRVLTVNLQGSFFLAQAAARHMRAQQSGGSILLMSSVTGHQAHAGLAAYGMTKAGLEMLARSLVIDLSPHGITINAVAPGATLTERTLDDPDYVPVWSAITPMGRPATVADIANAGLFLVSPASRQITGQTVVVDGGWSAVSVPPA